ncbi:thiol peroxidase [Desulfofustis glycolicus]|uniref:Thiol peroxidase n=1 Tax=Desulfofustis glycolicus DSM 9705 TaxID=1121409 RepID=A0A1M5VGU2_9BACT|nr:thiol peroxidase [Desulfofustis glycolicus]SHH74153.1 thiol peroxidase (atypical 2-Cys peroxiredoxin) [Desulfofustis glycolicus DSM 9705]
MATISLRGATIETVGTLPVNDSKAPAFALVKTDLSECRLDDFSGKTVVLNIFPSIDTPTCAASVRRFNEEAAKRDNTVVLCVSADLPFAHKRFCETEGIDNVEAVSTFRSPEFGKDYGVTVATGPIRGLLSRAVLVIDGSGKVVYGEQVPEIGQEPDYDAALRHL